MSQSATVLNNAQVTADDNSALLPLAGFLSFTVSNWSNNAYDIQNPAQSNQVVETVGPWQSLTLPVEAETCPNILLVVNAGLGLATPLSSYFQGGQQVILTQSSRPVSAPVRQSLVTQMAGLINATIENGTITATIDTSGGPVNISGNTAVTNTQLGMGLNFSGIGTVTVPANTTGQVNGSTIQLVPAGQSLSSSTLEVWVNSAINSDLTQVNLQLNMVFNDGSVATVANPTTSTINPVTSGPAFINLSAQDSITANTQGIPIQFNQVVVGVNMGTANSGDQTVSIRFVFSGLAVPDITSQNNPAMVSPSFQEPGTTGQTSMFNGVPLPTQRFTWDGAQYVANGAQTLKYWANGYFTLASGASVTFAPTVSRLFRCWISASELASLVVTGGGSLFTVQPGLTELDVEMAGGFAVGNTLYLLNRTTSTLTGSFAMIYE